MRNPGSDRNSDTLTGESPCLGQSKAYDGAWYGLVFLALLNLPKEQYP